MEIFVSLLPVFLWSAIFIILVNKFKFDKNIFIISIGIAALLNFRAILSAPYSPTSYIYIIVQTLFFYDIIDLFYNLMKRKKDSK